MPAFRMGGVQYATASVNEHTTSGGPAGGRPPVGVVARNLPNLLGRDAESGLLAKAYMVG